MMHRVELLGSHFDGHTLASSVDALGDLVAEGGRGWLATVNVAILMEQRRDQDLRRYVEGARWVVADGQPIVWLSRVLHRRPLPTRVTGVDLIYAVCARAEQEGSGVFLMGASRPVITAAAEALRDTYPNLSITFDDGYFSAEDATQRVRQIAESGCSYLFVGMGVPRQEKFILSHWDELDVNVAVAVGGSFEVLGGVRRRAPRWGQRLGLEWVFRLAQEPGRLWRRYLVTGTEFLALASRAIVVRRLLHPSSSSGRQRAGGHK